MQLFSTFVAALALANSALAGVYITNPVASTQGQGGQVLTVQWADDGKTPTVASIGPCTIDLYTGSVDTQVQLQNLAASVDVSKASSVSATIDPKVGQSGGYYFVRFTSLSLKDSKNPQYPYEAFSAKFTISSMSGNFNSTVMAAINAGSASSSTGAAASTVGAVSTAAKAATASVTGSGAAAATTSKSAALPQLAAPGLMAALVGIAGYIAL